MDSRVEQAERSQGWMSEAIQFVQARDNNGGLNKRGGVGDRESRHSQDIF